MPRSSSAPFSEDSETGHRALLAASGFHPVRHFFLMRRDAARRRSRTRRCPRGSRSGRSTEDHWRAILEAENEAFRDHWGHREMTDSTSCATFARPELDTDLWVVAWDGDEIAGVVQNWIWPEENERLGVKRGWLEHISVRRPWRRRGLARALTAASLVKLRDAGMDEGDARRRFGEPERRARAVHGSRVRRCFSSRQPPTAPRAMAPTPCVR